MANNNKLTQGRVKELFDYHEDGLLIWKSRSGVNGTIGEIAGSSNSNSNGYFNIQIDGSIYKLHRVIFLWHNGYLPEGVVDHEDQNPLNNREWNLRDVSQQCNMRNCKIRSDNLSGVTGVSHIKRLNKWHVQIQIDGVKKHLGYFLELDKAVLARYQKEIELNWNGCNSTSSSYLYLLKKRLLPKKKLYRRINK